MPKNSFEEYYNELITLNKTSYEELFEDSSEAVFIIDISVTVLFCSLMIFNLLIGMCLNLFFLITIAFNKKLRCQKYYGIISLSCVDLLVCAVASPLQLVREIISLNHEQSLSPVICSFITFISTFVSLSSVLSLVLISIERYSLFRNNKHVNKFKFLMFLSIVHLISFVIALLNAILNAIFKTVMHTRCTNEHFTERKINQIVSTLKRNEFIFTAFKLIFMTLGIGSIVAIIYSYVVICQIIRRKRITRLKLNNATPCRVNTNHSMVNRYGSNNSTINEYQNSLIIINNNNNNSNASREDEHLATFMFNHNNKNAANNSNSISFLSNIDNTRASLPSTSRPKHETLRVRPTRRRWSVDINTFLLNSHYNVGHARKKENNPTVAAINSSRRNSSSSYSNVTRINNVHSSPIFSHKILNQKQQSPPESVLALIERVAKIEPVISFQLNASDACSCKRYNSLKLNESDKMVKKEKRKSSKKKVKPLNDDDQTSSIGDTSANIKSNETTLNCCCCCKKLFRSEMNNSQVSVNQNSNISETNKENNSNNYAITINSINNTTTTTSNKSNTNRDSTTTVSLSSACKSKQSCIETAALRKTFIIILVFFLFWIPYLIVQAIILIHNNRSFLLEHLNLISIAIGFCHSSINPLVYCCTNIEIFNAMKAQFKRMSPLNGIAKLVNRCKRKNESE